MAIARLPISAFLEASANSLMLDVRSPGEYQHAHLPGAVSLPLFTNEERKVVGTAYKQVSREKAIKYGLDFFGPKMRAMVEEVERLLKQKTKDQKSETVYLYCWRGGMRSGAVAWLLDLYGFNVMVLAGGYKAFRNWVLEQLEHPYPLQVLGGYTGSGKTALLQELKNKGEAIIDLEQLANHKGSAFGKVDDGKQPTQELFENRLAIELSNPFTTAKPFSRFCLRLHLGGRRKPTHWPGKYSQCLLENHAAVAGLFPRYSF
jgi:tRNA 2-selenouridine synthase